MQTAKYYLEQTTVLHTTVGPVNVYKISEGQN